MAQSTARMAIDAILKVDEQDVSMHSLLALIKAKARQLPPNAAVCQLEPEQNPKLCCFDAAHVPSSWTANTLCARCLHLCRLMKVLPDEGTSSAAKSIIGSLLITTDCDGKDKQSPEDCSPQLPIELIDMIVNLVTVEMKHTRNGTSMAKLMHVSSQLRSKVVRMFRRIDLYEEDPPATNVANRLATPRALHQAVWDVLHLYANEVSTTHHVADPKTSGDEVITTTNGLAGTRVDCAVTLRLDDVRIGRSRRTIREYPVTSYQSIASKTGSVTVFDAIESLCLALNKLEPKFNQQAGAMAPFFVNVYERVLQGDCEAPSAVAVIDVLIRIGGLEVRRQGSNLASVSKCWQFSTVKVRRSAS